MEPFRTIVKCTASPEKIDYDTHLLMLGSCFAENMGSRLQQFKFDTTLNPFGIVYHPAPIAQNLRRIIAGKTYTADELQLNDELWYSFDHHGRFSDTNALDCLHRINTMLQLAQEQLAVAGWLFITFGTAWAYRLKSNGRIVANCHKLPASAFERIRFDVDEIYELWEETIVRLRQFNPRIKVVFSVSPIRHLRDGAHENQLSKSTLLLAVDRLIRSTPDTGYFPAYEIVLDELRDYRFYDAEMTHPSPLAIDYIWQRFCESYVADDAQKTMKEVESIVKAAAHRPIHHTSACLKFAAGYLEKIEKLTRQFPLLDLMEESEHFEDMIIKYQRCAK